MSPVRPPPPLPIRKFHGRCRSDLKKRLHRRDLYQQQLWWTRDKCPARHTRLFVLTGSLASWSCPAVITEALSIEENSVDDDAESVCGTEVSNARCHHWNTDTSFILFPFRDDGQSSRKMPEEQRKTGQF